MKLLLLTLVAGLLAAWICYRVSYQSGVATAQPGGRISSHGRERASREIPVAADKIEQLRGFLNRPFNERGSAEVWAVVSSMSVAQIRESVHMILQNKATDSAENMVNCLFFRWAQIDPMEALAAADSQRKDGGSENFSGALLSAFNGWFKRDPEAAFRWAQTDSGSNERFYISQMGGYLSTLPPTEAAEKMKTYGAAVIKAAFSYRARANFTSQEDRTAFFTSVANSGMNAADSQTVLKSFARNWGFYDPAAALAGLDGIPLNDDQKSQARQWIMAGWADKNPIEALAWVAKENPPHAIADQIAIYNKWLSTAPKEAVAALDELCRDAPGFREEVMKSQLQSYYDEGWVPYGRNISSDKFLFSRLKNHYDDWATTAPADAERWVGTLEPALQQKLHAPQ
jgi:hypothetical protein